MKPKINFSNFAHVASLYAGSSNAFMIALFLNIAWLISGPFFSFSDTWQLVINTATDIITFLMVFLIQNTQNRDGAAIQIKLDELIRAHHKAHTAILDLEKLNQEQLEHIRKKYEKLAKKARNGPKKTSRA